MPPTKTKSTKPKSALAKWPPRMTVKHKKALALLVGWARGYQEIELGGGAPVRFIGTLHELSLGGRATTFIFRNDYGVDAFISTDLYENVEINEIPGLPVTVGFYRKNLLGEGISLTPKQSKAGFDSKLEQVCAQFHTWIKLGTMLKTQIGDTMRSTISRSVIREIGSGEFLFSVADTETLYRVMPSRSDTLDLVREADVTVVVMFNNRSGSFFVVSDGIETPEDWIARFVGITNRVQ